MKIISDILDLSAPRVMGIINVNPHSFSSTGRCLSIDDAMNHAEKIIQEGAAIIDVGGEPTHPKQHIVISLQEELDRVIPFIEKLNQNFSTPISVDTSHPEVMTAAVSAGASLINDVRALRREGALQTAANLQVPICLMHMQYPDGNASTNSEDPYHGNVVQSVKHFLQERIDACLASGIQKEQIILDPGIGHGSFGKDLPQNLQLLNQLKVFCDMGFPILVGVSQKTFIGELLNVEVSERLYGSIAAAIYAVLCGVKIIRAHDVKATVQALQMINAIDNSL
ncbi:MAG: dihydropteroate synthase [Proteobacteria bacterium]|nr:dihydropteroate synthase [Pseudomonadota bacterium]